MKKFWVYLLETRGAIFPTSLAPVLVGTALAGRASGRIEWGLFCICAGAFILYHLGANVSNDYYDHRSGSDSANHDFLPPFTGGSRLIQKNILRPEEVLAEAWVLFLAGTGLGIALAFVAGAGLMLVWGFGFISAYYYSAPPWRWSDRGLGELLVGLNLGPLMVLTAYYVQVRSLSPDAWLASLPLAGFSAAILYVNEFPDVTADRATGKNNLVVRLGTARARLGYAGLLLAGYGSLAGWVLSRTPSRWSWLLLLPLCMHFICTRQVWIYHDQPRRLGLACGLTIGAQVLTGASMAWIALAA